MSQRKLTILGTSCFLPTKVRNHNGYFLKWDQEGFLFDPGEGTQRQMCQFKVASSKITKIFISHFHGDHCLGLAGVFQRLTQENITHPIEIYYPASGQIYLEHQLQASICQPYLHLIQKPIQKEGIVFEDEHLMISSKRLTHPVETYGYRIEEKESRTFLPEKIEALKLDKYQLQALEQEGQTYTAERKVSVEEVSKVKPGQSFAYLLDTGACKEAVKLAEGVDLLLSESTFLSSEAKLAKRYSHLTAAMAATIAKEAQVGKLLLTHFSPRYKGIGGFAKEAREIFKKTTAVQDGDVFSLPLRKREVK